MIKIPTFIRNVKFIANEKILHLKDILKRTDFKKHLNSEELNLHVKTSNGYIPTTNDFLFKCLLKALPINKKDSILDYGSGKGGAMAIFSKYPFKSIEGVELSDTLCKIARSNMRQLKIKSKIHNCDATEFTDLDRFTYFYLFNPFPAPVIEKVCDNIKKSLERKPRQIIILYKNPKHSEYFLNLSGLFRTITIKSAHDGKRYEIYSSNKKLRIKKNLGLLFLQQIGILGIEEG